jgi:uronate dehydrogenase
VSLGDLGGEGGPFPHHVGNPPHKNEQSGMERLKVLLTGAGGRIGPHLLPSFRERYELRVLDRNPIPDFPDTIIADLSDKEVLKQALEGVDVLVHLAAASDEAPFLEVLLPNNIIGLHNIFEAAREAGVRRIVFASTVQAVGFYPKDHKVVLSDPPRSVSAYGVTKVFGETLGRWYHDKYKMEFVAIRVGAFQPYDSQLLRDYQGFRDVWLSPNDCAGLLHRAIEKTEVGYALVFGTSITAIEFLDRAPMKELLDFEPQDDVNVLLAGIPTK